MEFVMSKSKIIIGAAVVAIGLGVAFKDTIQTHMYAFMHSSMHDRHSAGGMGHDMKNMPGLRGANASQAESDELALTRRTGGRQKEHHSVHLRVRRRLHLCARKQAVMQ